MSMGEPFAAARPALIERIWQPWRDARARASYHGNSVVLAGLYVAAVFGVVGYFAVELARLPFEKPDIASSDLVS